MSKRKNPSAPRRAAWTPTNDVARMSPAQAIKERRARLAMSQGELAAELGYNANFVSMLELGWSRVPLNKVGDLARILRLPGVWLMERVLATRIEQDGAAFYSFWFGPDGEARRSYKLELVEAARLLGR